MSNDTAVRLVQDNDNEMIIPETFSSPGFIALLENQHDTTPTMHYSSSLNSSADGAVVQSVTDPCTTTAITFAAEEKKCNDTKNNDDEDDRMLTDENKKSAIASTTASTTAINTTNTKQQESKYNLKRLLVSQDKTSRRWRAYFFYDKFRQVTFETEDEGISFHKILRKKLDIGQCNNSNQSKYNNRKSIDELVAHVREIVLYDTKKNVKRKKEHGDQEDTTKEHVDQEDYNDTAAGYNYNEMSTSESLKEPDFRGHATKSGRKWAARFNCDKLRYLGSFNSRKDANSALAILHEKIIESNAHNSPQAIEIAMEFTRNIVSSSLVSVSSNKNNDDKKRTAIKKKSDGQSQSSADKNDEKNPAVFKNGKRKKRDPNKPRRNLSSFILFSNANRDRIKEQNPGTNFGKIVSLKIFLLVSCFLHGLKHCFPLLKATLLAEEYKRLSPEEKKKLTDEADKDFKRYKEEMSNYTPTPGYKKRSKTRDPNKPKRGLSAYFLFSGANRAGIKERNPNVSFGDVAKLLAKEYKGLSPEEKNKWEAKAEVEKVRYFEEMKVYNGN